MRRVELLSPCGNFECLKAAIHNGCDAVYLSGKNFGARKYADNFTLDEIVEAIKYSHLYGVKVYVTVNTMIYEQEVDSVIEYLKFLYKHNVDAVIMQDIGIISKIRKILPGLEVHASTQCHNHNDEGLQLFKDLGVTRVVLDREMSINEIKELKTNIELEVFVYGALCVCYSGCCLFSSMNGGRSANRGACVGSCRLPYKFIEDDKYIKTNGEYLLSTRELNTLEHIKELIEAGIDSFKIEGRMKSPFYVGFVTKLYRTYIDKYYNHEDMTVREEDIINLKKLYNRKFTSGYLFNDNNVMNIMTPNHQGVEIGRVIDVNNKKITIKLNNYLSQNDGIRFKNSNKGMIINKLYNKKDLLVNRCEDIAVIDNKIGIKDKDIVLKTLDYELENNLSKYEEKKIGINYYVEAYRNKELVVVIDDGNNKIKYIGDKVEESINSPISREKIIYQLSKLGDTIYKVNNISIFMDNDIFISIKLLNEIRRYLTEELNKKRIGKDRDIVLREDNYSSIKKDNKIRINMLVRNREQLDCAIDLDIDDIYVTDYSLYKEYRDKYNNLYYRSKRVNDKYLDCDKVLITEMGGISRYKGRDMVSDYYLNIANESSIRYLESNNIKRVTLSVEDDYRYIDDIDFVSHNVELIIYGRIELMISKYCLLKEIYNNCKDCPKNKHKYYLEDRFNNKYPVIKDKCITHIMDYKKLDKINNVCYYIGKQIFDFRIELLDEDINDIKNIVNRVRVEVNRSNE